MGRPPKFSSPEDLEEKIAAWLADCERKGDLPTKGNLALFLDTTRETLGDYEKKEGYSDTLEKTYALIENTWVQKLKGQSVAGIIFYLKNAFGSKYRDRQEVDHTSKGDKIVPIYNGLSAGDVQGHASNTESISAEEAN